MFVSINSASEGGRVLTTQLRILHYLSCFP